MAKALRILLVAAVAVGASIGLGYATVCTFSAAEGLLVGSYADSILNPPKSEDVDFFTSRAGVPNIMILLDSSGSMLRMAPNGPSTLGTLPPAGIVGCGLDDTTNVATYTGPGTAIASLDARVWQSACGASLTSGKLGVVYDPATDYAHEASVCPKWVNPNPTTGSDGWDPDWYCGSGNTAASANLTCSGQNDVNYFDKHIVVHDTLGVNAGAYGGTYSTFGMRGDGWSNGAVMPHVRSGKPATIAEFCADLKSKGIMAATQGGVDTATICSTCLGTKGWFLDGRVDTNESVGDLSNQNVPSIWYTGNYLNFFPPKFLVARKVLKDTVMGFSKVRAAIAQFDSGSAEGAKVLQGFNPTCEHPDSNFDSNRTTYMSVLDGVQFSGGTPLSRALLDVGLYYHSTTLPWFNGTWGARTPWVSGQAPGNNANSYSICFSCQTSSVILVTDGTPTAGAEACSGSTAPLPVGASSLSQATSGIYAGDAATGLHPSCSTGAGGPSSTDCPECWAFTGADDYLNNLSRVAWYLHNFDLRKNSETTRDCQSNGGRQGIDFYAVNFNNSTANADRLLSNATKVGGGIFTSASNADEMRSALAQILENINTRSTSFSVATLSTLQSEAGHSVIVPRFDPARSAFWRGHLFRFELYSEFINGCAPGGGTGDLDCDGTCGGVFLQDAAGNFIQEDGSGAFKVNEPNRPSCSESKCASCGLPGGADATPWWDTGALLAERSWRTRKVYTAIDSSGDGRIDANDDTILIDTSDATVDKLIPYLNIAGNTACTSLATAIASAGDATTAADILADASLQLCAKELVRNLLGADVFNVMNRTGIEYPPRASATSAIDRDLLRDRDWKLGDIFHSSPVVVDAPYPSDGVLCPRGLARQCISSLWSTPTPHDIATVPTMANAYDGFAKDDRYSRRRKVVLVGANDGMLHAFNGGKWLADQDDPLTTGIDESKPPFSGFYERANSGDELWAFVPPDQLAKLPLLAGATHYIYVDGTPMVRDVWVDGSANAIHSATTADGQKQPWEFHTVAVVPERRGGVHHFALDITEASFQASETGFTAPRFLWIYPQPNDPEMLSSGETYSDFLPTPPPIGPVRVRADVTTGMPIAGVTQSTADAAGDMVPYHERWVAFLAGGFDPQYLRGQGVHMVDVWTGREIFDFSRPSAGSGVAATDPRWQLKFPVPATVSMVMWGKTSKNLASSPNEGFFDTATFGDAGGQLWVVRFNDPGILDPTTKKAGNWFGGRMFQMGAAGAQAMCTNEPFFYIAANVALTTDGTLRTLAGTGDRYNLIDTNGGQCGPDNIRACLQRGCRVTMDSSANRGSSGAAGARQAAFSSSACGAPTFGDPALTSTTPCGPSAASKVVIDNCGGSGPSLTSTKDISVACTGDALGYGCSVTSTATGPALPVTTPITQLNKFFSVRVFDAAGARAVFSDLAGAADYDGARLTDSTLVQIDGAAASPTTLADASSPGWALTFNHAGAVVVNGVSYTVSAVDERVSSTAAVAGNCVFWNTTQTTSAAAAAGKCDVSTCKQVNRRLHYFYGADVATGGLCGLFDASGNALRYTTSVALVPPPAPQYTVFVNSKGQVQVGMTSVNTEIGAKSTSAGTAIDPATVLQSIDVPQRLHDCRHSDPAGASPACN